MKGASGWRYGVLHVFPMLLALTVAAGVNAQSGYSLQNDWQGRPDWLDLGFQHRSHLEFLDGQFRQGRSGSDQAWLTRTHVQLGIKTEKFRINTELMDSQIRLADSGTPINSALVNPLDILQANVELAFADQFRPGSTSSLRLGRFTADIGSRRFVARPRYRNTLNAFTGMHYDWQGGNGSRFQAVYAMPVVRLYDGNPLYFHPEADDEHGGQRFLALHAAKPDALFGDTTELQFFSINESDSASLQTADREIYSLGLRQFRSPALSQWSYEVELLLQQGSLRSSAAVADTTTLDHRAWYIHLNAEYTLDLPWQPRLGIVYDHGSGDSNPNDGNSRDFAMLYGVPRPDFGPTNLYGPVVYTNLVSPGVRGVFRPSTQLTATFTARNYRLASTQGAWERAGYPAFPGNREAHIGTQFESRFQFNPARGNLAFETGLTWLKAGDYLRSMQKGNARFFFFSFTVSI
jgi:hypothetical protein